jgi:protein-S-isoprenylcysteine O-methyltransferase Ste14
MAEPESLATHEALAAHVARHAYDRLLMLSDGIFAIATTLAALEIRVPLSIADPTAALSAFWVPLVTYAVSFSVIAIFWLSSRDLFARLARVTLGRNWSAIPELKQGHELVTGGPYAIVRHPIYTGLLLMFAAVALLWATWAGLFLLLVVVLGIQLKLSREETLLAGEFPDQWPAYRARTRRVLPLLW